MVLRHLDPTTTENSAPSTKAMETSAVLHRHLAYDFLAVVKAEGSYLVLDDGRMLFDASGGAAVGCIGWGDERVARAVMAQMMAIPYCTSVFYTTKVQEELCRYLVDSTNGEMSRAYIVSSGECYPGPRLYQ